MADQRDYRIASVDRALTVLERLAERPDQGVTEIARELGMTKSIVFRILQTLEARGFVSRNAERSVYGLGYRVAVLGERAGHRHSLLLAAREEMDALSEETSENINLLVRDGNQILVLATREGRHSMRLFAAAGRYGPLHAGGGSLLLLAFAPPELREEILAGTLTRFTDATMTEPDVLRHILQRIRDQGWNIAKNDLDEGAFSVAAPISTTPGEVIAALSIAGPLARLNDNRQAMYLTAVRGAAQRISAKLSIGGPAEPAPAVSAEPTNA
ncbi:MAG: IclR family transcriptional regulator [Pseudomonadota bacterium]